MPLQKQKIAIPFVEGIDTKTDSFQTIPTRLLELENGVFTKVGKINKRFGYDILSTQVLSSGSNVTEGRGLARYRDELVLFDGARLLSFLDANNRWTEKGSLVSLTSTNESIIRNPYQQTAADFASNGTISVYVWEDSRGGLRYSVLDESSGSFIVSDQEYKTGAEKPKVYALGNNFVLTYITGNTISAQTIPVLAPGTRGSEIEITAALDPSDKVYDASLIENRLYIAFNTSNASSSVGVLFLQSNLSISSTAEEVAEEATTAITVIGDSDSDIWVFYHDGSDVKAFAYERELQTQLLAPTSVETVSGVRNITAINTGTQITALYEIENTTSGNPDNFIRQNTITFGGTVGTASDFVRSLGLASKLFTQGNEFYVYTAHESDLQSTYFVYSLNGDIISKANTNVGGGYTAKSLLPEVVNTRTDVYKTALLRKVQLLSENGNVFTRLGVEANRLDFTGISNFFTAELGDNLHIAGGVMQVYDGVSVVEQGFNVFPENVTISEINAGTGDIANGQYQYVAVYAWTDNQGQLHRSAPSIPSTITVVSGPSDVELTIPTLRITKKQDAFIEVYRTEASGTVFYKVTTVDSPLFNNLATDTVTFTDSTLDSVLINNEVLYTTGGVLENIAPPASNLVTTFKNRLITNDPDDPNTFRFSKQRREGFPIEFNDTLLRITDSRGGDISALAALDDKLILFKENAIFYTAGDGPNNLGLQDDFIEPQLVTTDVGCTEPKSVVEMPQGLMFKSRKGIYLLDRSLSVQYIGAAVEDFNNLQTSSAVLVADRNEVRFTSENSVALVYNYFFGQWSTFTNHQAEGATNYEDQYTFVKVDGRVFQENATKFTDGADSYRLRFVTSWIKLSGVNGFQRVYKALLLGNFLSAHKLLVRVGFNYNPVYTQEVQFDPGTILQNSNYGAGSPYGSDSFYGGSDQLYQWELNFKRQKCESIRLEFQDVQEDNFGEGYSISHLTFLIGQKMGLNQTGTGKNYGTS